MAGSSGILVVGGLAAAAYFTRASWLPLIEGTTATATTTGTATGATGSTPTAPTTTTANQTPSSSIPGAVAIGTQGCYEYPTGTDGQTVINCPPGVSPPATTPPPVNCASGFTQDAAGICTQYPDSYLLANLNTIPWSNTADVPTEQLSRIDPQVAGIYTATTGVNAGTVLAYILGLGGTQPDGTIMNGTDGNAYKSQSGVFYRQGVSTQTTVNGVRLGALRAAISNNVPVTNATLIMASADPATAALIGRNPRAMLTGAQWNAYYTQATGIVQGVPLHPGDDPQALMSAEQYQARRAAAGLQTTTNLGRLGAIRTARRGAFPLGRAPGRGVLGQAFTQWVPPGNRTIYQIPGRGAVPAGRGGRVPARTNVAGLGAVVNLTRMGVIQNGGGDHRFARSPFPRPSWWRTTNAS